MGEAWEKASTHGAAAGKRWVVTSEVWRSCEAGGLGGEALVCMQTTMPPHDMVTPPQTRARMRCFLPHPLGAWGVPPHGV